MVELSHLFMSVSNYIVHTYMLLYVCVDLSDSGGQRNWDFGTAYGVNKFYYSFIFDTNFFWFIMQPAFNKTVLVVYLLIENQFIASQEMQIADGDGF